ncbi:E1 ubiquitin-activating protein aos1 [Fusarium falciforme]|uniref:Ubiquitin-like 1-activating enzyme E1A n=1 Tax=Fusarium falciforme TaxID=195108 RepID=A0A9W8RAV6_9HYPO|nr:E1 ubiquitin-activating protein aos1 [Fusarium falciforme]KAJ4192134.1 E1 ubiquitin-activating protein aos1 [Fusarium falciforme]KAJ4254627.1 E1 ubiquitin-activating protein aos1 [Fusarium falciforme]
MDASNQNQGQPPVAPQAQQLPDASAAAAMPPVDAGANLNGNGIPQLPDHLLGSMNPEAMAGMMPDPSLMADPTMLAAMQMPLADPSAFMMQPGMAIPNGQPHAFGVPVAPPATVSADEIALYDRQIRLWGMAAQAKIQSANILLITIKALANEIAKNLVLAGIGSLTLLDGAVVTEADRGSQFFLADDDSIIGQNRAQAASAALQKLNPRVRVHVDTEGVKTKGPSYFAGFDIVIATDLDPESFNIINTATRLNCKAFYAAGCHGLYGFIFSDLIEHDYVIQRDLGNVPTIPGPETRTRTIVDVQTRKEGPKTIESVTKRELYSTWFLASDVGGLPEEYTQSRRRLKSVTPALSCLRALWEFMQIQGGRVPSNRDDLKMFTQIATQKHKALGLPSETLRPEFLRSFLQNLVSEISPVAAILGGQLAQDVINVLGQTQQPIQNMVVFDGNTMEGLMYPLHPEGSLGSGLLTDHQVPNGGAPMMLPTGMDALPMGIDPTAMGALPHHNNPIMIPGGLQNGMGLAMQDAAMTNPTQQFNPAQAPQQPPQQDPQQAPQQAAPQPAAATAEQPAQEALANPGNAGAN